MLPFFRAPELNRLKMAHHERPFLGPKFSFTTPVSSFAGVSKSGPKSSSGNPEESFSQFQAISSACSTILSFSLASSIFLVETLEKKMKILNTFS